MDTFTQLIEEIKEQPLKHLPKRSILVLHDYLNSYRHIRRKLDIPFTKSEYAFTKFIGWTQEKFNAKPAFTWSIIILLHSEDEREALNRFFSLYEEFKSEKNFDFDLNFDEDMKVYSSLKGKPQDLHPFVKRNYKFLINPSVFNLEGSINGYRYSKRTIGLPGTEQERLFEEFKDWVSLKLDVQGGLSWSNIIRFRSYDDKHSLNLCLNLFEEFFKEF